MKLLEYMAAARAIVSSTKGAEGIAYADGRDLRIADAPEAFAREVLDLLDDPAEARQLGQRARAFASRYDWRHIADASCRPTGGRAAARTGTNASSPIPSMQPSPGPACSSRRPPSPGPCSCW